MEGGGQERLWKEMSAWVPKENGDPIESQPDVKNEEERFDLADIARPKREGAYDELVTVFLSCMSRET